MPGDLLSAIRTSIQGLNYPSESDAPFEIFSWDASRGELTAESLAALGRKGKKKAPRVRESTVEDFFAGLADSEDAARFKNLESLLRKNLSNLTVFRVGSIKVDIYLVGRTPEGLWLGLHTISTET